MKNEKDVELIVYAPRIAMMLLDYKDVKELGFEGVTEAKKNTRYAPGLRCEVDRITLFKQENGEKMIIDRKDEESGFKEVRRYHSFQFVYTKWGQNLGNDSS